jgi:hypothetical protein
MNWWLYQIVACVFVTVGLTYGRWYGDHNPNAGVLVPWAAISVMEIAAALCFLKSYITAPSFFQPWFLGTAVISLLGLIPSLFLFNEVPNIIHIFGAVLAIAGSVLLVL